MKQVLILVLCVLLADCQLPLTKDYCKVDHSANIARLESIADDLNSLISTLKKELRCEKPGRVLNPMTNCKDLPPGSKSGEYWIKPDCGRDPFKGYCDTEPRCNAQGGWLKVAGLDMTNREQTCPDGFRLVTRTTPPLRTCGRTVQDGCSSMIFPVNGTEYSKVCGRVKAYQVASPDGFFRNSDSDVNIDRSYVDGVSVTHGNPRTHIWTFASSWTNAQTNNGCPCVDGNDQVSVPSFVGEEYFCETGQRNEWAGGKFYPDNPLWDGQGCDDTTSCCDNQPWFCRDLSSATTEDIEVRLCGDQNTGDEDTPIEAVEIYIN